VTDRDIDEATSPDAAAERLLEKVRLFVRDQLTHEERALFAVLLAPAVADASGMSDVSGFAAMDQWEPAPLPEYLANAVRTSHIQLITD
jgi:hypothetical protein